MAYLFDIYVYKSNTVFNQGPSMLIACRISGTWVVQGTRHEFSKGNVAGWINRTGSRRYVNSLASKRPWQIVVTLRENTKCRLEGTNVVRDNSSSHRQNVRNVQAAIGQKQQRWSARNIETMHGIKHFVCRCDFFGKLLYGVCFLQPDMCVIMHWALPNLIVCSPRLVHIDFLCVEV